MSGNNITTGAAFEVKYLLTDLESIGLQKQNKLSKFYIEIQSFYIPQHCTNKVFSYIKEITINYNQSSAENTASWYLFRL